MKRSERIIVSLAGLGLLLGLSGWQLPACLGQKVSNEIRLSGWVEVDTVRIAPLIGGRIVELNLEEGESVRKDQVVARLDCRELELQLGQAQASRKGASAQSQMVKKGARNEDIANVRELVKQAEIALDNAKRDRDRAAALLASKSITQKQFDDAKSRYDSTEAQLAALRQQYAKIRSGSRVEEKETAEAMVEQAESVIALLKEKLSHCVVDAPADGVVINKLVEKGEIIGPGGVMAIVGKMARVKVKGYVAEEELGFIKIGQNVSIFIDSEPTRPIPGKVTFIASQAEFTPKNIQTQQERIKTMYEIRVTVDNSDGKLKAGMPADIVMAK
jgi:HlyD family secretion protein